MISATQDAIDILGRGDTPVVFRPFPGPLEPAAIYLDLAGDLLLDDLGVVTADWLAA